MVLKRNSKPRRRIVREEKLSVPVREKLDELAYTLSRKIDAEIFAQKSAHTREVLKLIGAGIFLATAFAAPNSAKAFRGLYRETRDYEAWKRFNIPYLKRTLRRLEEQKLVEIGEQNNLQVVSVTDAGRKRILRFAIDEITIEKPKRWDHYWWFVSYDLPQGLRDRRNLLGRYLTKWGFYPFHESVYLHAYPCEKEVEFLREYLGVGEYVRIIQAAWIENDEKFRAYFDV